MRDQKKGGKKEKKEKTDANVDDDDEEESDCGVQTILIREPFFRPRLNSFLLPLEF